MKAATVAPLFAHTAIELALLAVYTVLTLAGHDANSVLVGALGWLGGAGAQAAISRAPTPPER